MPESCARVGFPPSGSYQASFGSAHSFCSGAVFASIDRIMEKIASLVQDKKLTGVSDLRNESSDRNGTRLVVELKRDAVPQVVLNDLFKFTQLQDTFQLIQ